MPVEINAHVQPSDPSLLAALQRAGSSLLEALGRRADEVEVSLVDDTEMQSLNERYRGKDRPTDVLSFAQLEGESIIAGPGAEPQVGGAVAQPSYDAQHLGDVVISIDTAGRQAEQGGWTLAEECTRLLLHGLLHLLGYEHEQGGEPEQRMKAEEKRLIGVLATAGIACAHDEA